jgi:plastocyanin
VSTATPRHLVSLAASLLLIVGSIGAAAASGSGDAPTRDTKTVRAISDHWSPTTVRISAGDGIRWKAVSNSHTVTAYRGGWRFDESLASGQAVRHRFAAAGIFRFRCRIHSSLVNGVCSGMCGKVVVSA